MAQSRNIPSGARRAAPRFPQQGNAGKPAGNAAKPAGNNNPSRTFNYEALDVDGKPHSATIEANSAEHAAEQLRARKLYPTTIRAAQAGGAEPPKPTPVKPGLFKRAMSSKGAKLTGLGALGALGVVVGQPIVARALGVDRKSLMIEALNQMSAGRNQAAINDASREASDASYRASIQTNLGQIQRYAPDLYMSVAAGRKLPQGAVVIGGSPRQDLLNELGRAMSDGRFSQ